MDPRQVNIESIELYLKGAMSPEEARAFEAKLKSDSVLAGELEAYKVIFSGFQGLAGAEFGQKLESWSSEWKDSDEEETMLIEAYLKAELHPELIKEVEARLSSDKAFAEKIGQYRKLLAGFETISNEDFKNKIQTWEKQSPGKGLTNRRNSGAIIRPLYRRLAIAASFLLVISVGLKWYASSNFSENKLVETAYFRPETGGTMGGQDPETVLIVEQQFAEAHDLMEEGQYEMAAESFDNVLMSLDVTAFSESRKTAIKDNATFSQALALLAVGEDVSEVKVLLEELIRETEDNFYKTRAQELLEKINSFWFKIG